MPVTHERSQGEEHPRMALGVVHTAELLSFGSVEMCVTNNADVRIAADLLPAGTRVYIPFLRRQSLSATLESLIALHAAGLDPVPHLAARSIESRVALQRFLARAVREAGVRRVLLIGGDMFEPAGPYADSVALLAEQTLAEAGIREIGIAGYPEGHPRIASHALDEAFAHKLTLARSQGLGLHVVTQFSFAPLRIVEYCAELARRAPMVPVYVGVMGPTAPWALLKYAQRCGVSASLRALSDLGLGAAKLVTHTDPMEQITAVAHYCEHRETCNVAGVHLYTFGAFLRTARWINTAIAAGASPLHRHD